MFTELRLSEDMVLPVAESNKIVHNKDSEKEIVNESEESK